jgi:hypothetical protein
MKTLLMVVIMVLLPGLVFASPFLISDPNTALTDPVSIPCYIVTGPVLAGTYPAQADGSCKIDLYQCPVGGPYTIQVKGSTLWGGSASVPFTFSRPSLPGVPGNLKLIP